MGPGALNDVLAGLRLPTNPDLLVGLDRRDDAAVYRLGDQLALVQTVDFFPPIVDDPYDFGAIAAANALSDIYAMGGRPILALALGAFPEDMPASIIRAILQGGADTIAAAGAVIGGGHTVIDREPKYGLCVTGLIDPHAVTTKGGARVGDVLFLTKALGTGIITTAIKRDRGQSAHLAGAVASMRQLNREAAELAKQVAVHAVTDITGFGLLGHGVEMAQQSGVCLRIDGSRLPALPGALAYADLAIVPGGLDRNQSYLESLQSAGEQLVRIDPAIDVAYVRLLYDPQTSGGLLLALAPKEATRLGKLFAEADLTYWEVGDAIAGEGVVVVPRLPSRRRPPRKSAST